LAPTRQDSKLECFNFKTKIKIVNGEFEQEKLKPNQFQKVRKYWVVVIVIVKVILKL
jgi:hypothetical protein